MPARRPNLARPEEANQISNPTYGLASPARILNLRSYPFFLWTLDHRLDDCSRESWNILGLINQKTICKKWLSRSERILSQDPVCWSTATCSSDFQSRSCSRSFKARLAREFSFQTNNLSNIHTIGRTLSSFQQQLIKIVSFSVKRWFSGFSQRENFVQDEKLVLDSAISFTKFKTFSLWLENRC